MSQQPQVRVAKLYVKDLSFEAPNAPKVFREGWRPEIKMDVSTSHRPLNGNFHEVSLELTVEAKEGKEVGFIVEVEHCGIFEVSGFEAAQMDRVLRVFAPTTLFPYVRQVIDTALLNGGFPPLMLAPINFENMQPVERQGAAAEAPQPQ